ncbi:tail fiber chaperone [Acinetobacter phage Acj9]|uniref:Gp57A chaperone for tail fiber formation n=1 Tax=Acinetobacter phage Acj9 TaxID=760939 RepID=E5EPT8_9CAUD|nr:tail fiber chaperone [Acinetobacter phage Acj9]ADG60054.1 hypothetical protein Acj9p154 [Acinetobacter phage Acj9]
MSNEVIELKAKMFDLIETNQALGAKGQELASALQAIAETLGLVPDEGGNLALAEIVNGVHALVVPKDAQTAE